MRASHTLLSVGKAVKKPRKAEEEQRPGVISGGSCSDHQPLTRTSLKLRSTRPPEAGRPKLICGVKLENIST